VAKNGKMGGRTLPPCKKIASRHVFTLPPNEMNSMTAGLVIMTGKRGRKSAFLSSTGVCFIVHGLSWHIAVIYIFIFMTFMT
jgi:hypothetical protein